MTLTVASPSLAPPAPPPPPRRRRLRRLLVATASVGVVAVVATWLLAPQLAWLGTSGAPEFDGEVVAVPEYGARGLDVVMHEHHGEVAVEATLTNDGLLPVSVSDARFSDKPKPLLEVTAAEPVDGSFPVTLWPGDAVRVRVEAAMVNCRYYHEREAQLMDGLVLDTSVLGRGSTETAAFPHELVVRSPMIVDCPDRTLNREDHTRR